MILAGMDAFIAYRREVGPLLVTDVLAVAQHILASAKALKAEHLLLDNDRTTAELSATVIGAWHPVEFVGCRAQP